MVNPTQYFHTLTFDMGDVKADTKEGFSFKLKGSAPFKIQSVKPGCGGCTFVKVTEDEEVTGYIDITRAVGRDPRTRAVVLGKFGKEVTVYLDDGKPYQIHTEDRVLKVNFNKAYIVLKIVGNVIK